MQAIKSANTGPELAVREIVRELGYEFDLHGSDLPGTPDLVFREYRRDIFVHGCYWHRHRCRLGKVVPKSNTEFWLDKFEKNVRRDRRVRARIRGLGWHSLSIWQCQLGRPDKVINRVQKFFDS